MKFIVSFVLLFASLQVFADVPPKTAVRNAMKSGTCQGVPDEVVGELTKEERKYLENCWRAAQKKRLEEAERTGTCTPLLQLPGVSPLGTEAERRRIFACWLSEGYLVHDAALGAADVPGDSLIPALIHALELNPPLEDGTMICTTSHIIEALKKITGRSCGNTADDWRKCSTASR